MLTVSLPKAKWIFNLLTYIFYLVGNYIQLINKRFDFLVNQQKGQFSEVIMTKIHQMSKKYISLIKRDTNNMKTDFRSFNYRIDKISYWFVYTCCHTLQVS